MVLVIFRNQNSKSTLGMYIQLKNYFNFSVLQGSFSGANEFCWYSGTLNDHIKESTNLSVT